MNTAPKLRELIMKHRHHVELSPGVGEDAQHYALVVIDDILIDVDALAPPSGEGVDDWRELASEAVYVGLCIGVDCAGKLAELQEAGIYKPRCEDGKPSNANARRDADKIADIYRRGLAKLRAADALSPRPTTPQSAPVDYSHLYNVPLAKSIAESLGQGFKLIYRDAFRWKNSDGDVLPNHYDGQDATGLAASFDYDLVADLGFAAIIRTTPPTASQERGGDLLCKLAAAMREVTRFAPSMVYRGSRMEKAWDDAREALADFDNYVASPPSSAAEEHSTSASQYDFHVDGRDNKRQPQGTTSGSSPGYSRPSTHAGHFELDEGDRMTLRCALVSFSEELKRDGLGTDDHGVRMTAAYLARISRLLTRINNSAAEYKTCNGLGIVGGVSGQTPESMEQVTENCPDCSDDVTAGGTSISDEELPGMWSPSDLTGGATDAAEQDSNAAEGPKVHTEQCDDVNFNLPHGSTAICVCAAEQAKPEPVRDYEAETWLAAQPKLEQAQAGEIDEAIEWLENLNNVNVANRKQAIALFRRLASGVTVDDAMRERFKVAFHSRPNETRTYDEALHDALVAALGAKDG